MPPCPHFTGKVFLVTGASSGIGAAVASALLDRGAAVAAVARSEAALLALSATAPDRVLPFPGDVRSREVCFAAVAAARERFGRIDGLIHAAGLSMRAPARDTDVAVYETLMATNFYAMLHLYQAAVGDLVAARGHLVAISSMMGRYSSQLRSGYCASKHALQGFMDAVRLEHAAEGLHCLVVSPGFVRTGIAHATLAGDGTPHGKMTRNIDRGLAPESVAAFILDAVAARRRDGYPSGLRERAGLFLSRFAPAFLDRQLLRRDTV